MFLCHNVAGGKIYEVVRELSDGLSFLCRRVRIDPATGVCVPNPDLCSLKLFRAIPDDEGYEAYFENISLFRDWTDLVAECGECTV